MLKKLRLLSTLASLMDCNIPTKCWFSQCVGKQMFYDRPAITVKINLETLQEMCGKLRRYMLPYGNLNLMVFR